MSVSVLCIMQGFHWESSTPDCRDPSQWPDGEVTTSWYATVEKKVEDMREAGITDIWLPPPSQSVAKEGYLPTKLYDLNSAYGTYKELRALLRTLQAQGVGAILDVVINHRCGDRQNENGKWVLYSDELSHDNKRLDWGPWALVSNHPDPDLAGTGAAKEQPHYHAAPNVDHSNSEVRLLTSRLASHRLCSCLFVHFSSWHSNSCRSARHWSHG